LLLQAREVPCRSRRVSADPALCSVAARARALIVMPRTDANARPARAARKPLRFAEEEKYATEIPPWVLRQRAGRKQADDDDSAQSGEMTGEEFVAQEKQAAEDAGMSRQREKAPVYDRDAARPEKVKLPPGWTASKPDEVEKYFENLTRDETFEIARLHCYAYFSGGGIPMMGKDATKKWKLDHGLVVGPWHKHGFPGMCNSEALGKQRFAKAAQESNVQRSSDAAFDRLGDLGLPKEGLSHGASYQALVRDDMLTVAFLRGKPVPAGDNRATKVQEWLPLEVDVCVDCGRRRQLLRVEHAKGGEHDGERRKPPCKADNVGERAAFDAYADALYLIGEQATPAGYQGVLDVRLAYAGRPGASAEDKMLLAMGRRAAAEATVLEDREALSYGSSLRGRRVCNDLGPTLEDARAKFQKKEDARMAVERRKKREWDEKAAERAALPPVKVGMRVVVIDEKSRYHGSSGVVQGFRGHVHIAVLLAGDASDRCFYRRALRIETPRKPSARKPAARKPAAKPAARKPSVRKSRK